MYVPMPLGQSLKQLLIFFVSHFIQASKVIVNLAAQLKLIPPASALVFGQVSLRSMVVSRSGLQNAGSMRLHEWEDPDVAYPTLSGRRPTGSTQMLLDISPKMARPLVPSVANHVFRL